MTNRADDQKFKAFIEDDNGDVTQGPAESYIEAMKRASDAMSSPRNVGTWVKEVK